MPKESAPSRAQPFDASTGLSLKDQIEATRNELAATKSELAAHDQEVKAQIEAKRAEIAKRTKELEDERERLYLEGQASDASDKKKKSDAGEKNKNAVARMKAAGSTRMRKTGTSKSAEVAVEATAKEAATPEIAAPALEIKKPTVVVPKISAVTPRAGSAVSGAPVTVKEAAPAVEAEAVLEKGRTNFDVLAERFAKDGLGEITAKLSSLPEFKALPEGQQLLVMQGMSDRLYEHIKTEGAKSYQERRAKKTIFGKAWDAARKTYLTAKTEKKAFKEVAGAGSLAFIQKTAPELIEVFGKTGLSAYLSQDGKTVVTKYSALEGGASFSGSHRYDVAASKLARIPDDWNKPTASANEKAAYRKAEQDYFAAKQQYLAGLLEEAKASGIENPEASTAAFASQSETMVRTMRLLSAHPDVYGRISYISKTPAWIRGSLGTITERTALTGVGAYSNYGRLGRATTAALFGAGSAAALAAAPILAGVVGGFSGYSRAKSGIRERDRLARAGVAQEGKTAKRMSDVDRKIRQLNDTKLYLETETSPIEREKALVRLRTYSDFIEAKLELGQVNFGGEKDRFGRQYELMRSLHEAKVALAMSGVDMTLENMFKDDNVAGRGELGDRAKSFGALVHHKTESARTREIVRKTAQGVAFGALAGSAGSAARWFGDHVGWDWLHAGGAAHHHSALPTPDAAQPAPAAPIPAANGNALADTRKFFSPEQPHLSRFGASVEHGTLSVDAAGKLAETPIDVDQALARVTFSSRGAEQTLLDFRHSADFSKLTPDEQRFFEGNLDKIAQELKGFRPNALDGKESLSVGVGSQFGIAPDGRVFITDTLHGGKVTTLGHFENGVFKSDDPEGLQYIHAGARARHVEKSSAMSVDKEGNLDVRAPKQTAEELGIRSNDAAPGGTEGIGPIADPDEYARRLGEANPVASPISYEEITPEMQKELGMYNQDLRDIDPGHTDYIDRHHYTPDQEFSLRKLTRVERVTDRMIRHQVNRFFSYRNPFTGQEVLGQYSPVWLSYSHRPVRSILAQDMQDPIPAHRVFVSHIRALAAKYPDLDRNQPLGVFMKEAYRYKAEQRVLGETIPQ